MTEELRRSFADRGSVIAEPDGVVVLRSYAARFEVSSEPSDPDMDHFNDHLIACQALERVDGAVAVDLADGSFMSGKIII